jgi:hypothetical protein
VAKGVREGWLVLDDIVSEEILSEEIASDGSHTATDGIYPGAWWKDAAGGSSWLGTREMRPIGNPLPATDLR